YGCTPAWPVLLERLSIVLDPRRVYSMNGPPFCKATLWVGSGILPSIPLPDDWVVGPFGWHAVRFGSACPAKPKPRACHLENQTDPLPMIAMETAQVQNGSFRFPNL